MSNPINAAAVGSALGIPADYINPDILKRLVIGGFLPAPIGGNYDAFDLTAIYGVLGNAAAIKNAASKIATEHRGGIKAGF